MEESKYIINVRGKIQPQSHRLHKTMNIYKATKKAIKAKGFIANEAFYDTEDRTGVVIQPGNSKDGCICIYVENGKEKSRCKRWQPTADLLVSKEWIVVLRGDKL